MALSCKFINLELLLSNVTLHVFQARNGNLSISDVSEDLMAAKIRWDPPRDPNEFIANYRVRIRHNLDGEGISKDSITCVNARDFEEMGHVYKLEFPGR